MTLNLDRQCYVTLLGNGKTNLYAHVLFKVFLVRKVKGNDTGRLYAMKVLKKATLKGSCGSDCCVKTELTIHAVVYHGSKCIVSSSSQWKFKHM